MTFKMADNEQVEEIAADILFHITWCLPGHWLATFKDLGL